MSDPTPIVVVVVVVVVALVVAGAAAVRRRRGGEGPEPSPSRPSVPGGVLAARLRAVFGAGVDDSTWERLEEALLAADVGVEAAPRVVDRVRSERPGTVEEARGSLAAGLRSELLDGDRGLDLGGEPSVVLVVGVNGSGKTTTIAKLARRLRDEGRSVLLGAADTFRAAAGEQLGEWAERVGVGVVAGERGADAASVAHDAVSSARAKGIEVVIIDTAGRLHGDKNLMAELAKIHRVASAAAQVGEVLLVLDATSGQNGLAQVARFAEAVPLTGIALTKLDGTARGGIVVAVEERLGVPVKLVGLGEGLGDLEPFDPDSFVASLLEEP